MLDSFDVDDNIENGIQRIKILLSQLNILKQKGFASIKSAFRYMTVEDKVDFPSMIPIISKYETIDINDNIDISIQSYTYLLNSMRQIPSNVKTFSLGIRGYFGCCLRHFDFPNESGSESISQMRQFIHKCHQQHNSFLVQLIQEYCPEAEYHLDQISNQFDIYHLYPEGYFQIDGHNLSPQEYVQEYIQRPDLYERLVYIKIQLRSIKKN